MTPEALADRLIATARQLEIDEGQGVALAQAVADLRRGAGALRQLVALIQKRKVPDV